VDYAFGAIVLAATSTGNTTGKSGGGAGSTIFIFVLLIALGVMMWFFNRKNRKRTEDQLAFRKTLGPGSRVMTAAGMIGVVSRIEGDVVMLMNASGDESAYLKRAITKLISDDEWDSLTTAPEEPGAEDDAAAEPPAADQAPKAEGQEPKGSGETSGPDGDEPPDPTGAVG
jgi:preprotein translocase YajC subunit